MSKATKPLKNKSNLKTTITMISLILGIIVAFTTLFLNVFSIRDKLSEESLKNLSVSGHVYVKGTKQPISNVRIEIIDKPGIVDITDENGKFFLKDLTGKGLEVFKFQIKHQDFKTSAGVNVRINFDEVKNEFSIQEPFFLEPMEKGGKINPSDDDLRIITEKKKKPHKIIQYINKAEKADIAIMVLEIGKNVNYSLGQIIANQMRSKGLLPSTSFFSSKFASSGTFDTLFESNLNLSQVGLDEYVDHFFLLKIKSSSFEQNSPDLGNTITAHITYEAKIFTSTTGRLSDSRSYPINGLGVDKKSAIEKAEEILVDKLKETDFNF